MPLPETKHITVFILRENNAAHITQNRKGRISRDDRIDKQNTAPCPIISAGVYDEVLK
jgi:hypothetical protein